VELKLQQKEQVSQSNGSWMVQSDLAEDWLIVVDFSGWWFVDP